jgi:peptide/nickel transport system substrate-binding protein
MRRLLRTSSFATAALTLAALALLASSASAPAATDGARARQAAHRCLVMTGSGDPAFVKNFNPFAGGGLPSNAFAQGAMYEPLIAVPSGGRKTIPWLARSWKWSHGNKTLTLHIATNAKWSDGKPLTSADVVYSLTAGRQDKAMDRIGLVGEGNNVASVKAKGAHTVVIRLKTPDSQFIPAILNRAFVVPKHIWSKVSDPATFTNSNPSAPGRSTSSRASRRRTTSSTGTRTTGSRACRRSRASNTCRQRRTTPRWR